MVGLGLFKDLVGGARGILKNLTEKTTSMALRKSTFKALAKPHLIKVLSRSSVWLFSNFCQEIITKWNEDNGDSDDDDDEYKPPCITLRKVVFRFEKRLKEMLPALSDALAGVIFDFLDFRGVGSIKADDARRLGHLFQPMGKATGKQMRSQARLAALFHLFHDGHESYPEIGKDELLAGADRLFQLSVALVSLTLEELLPWVTSVLDEMLSAMFCVVAQDKEHVTFERMEKWTETMADDTTALVDLMVQSVKEWEEPPKDSLTQQNFDKRGHTCGFFCRWLEGGSLGLSWLGGKTLSLRLRLLVVWHLVSQSVSQSISH